MKLVLKCVSSKPSSKGLPHFCRYSVLCCCPVPDPSGVALTKHHTLGGHRFICQFWRLGSHSQRWNSAHSQRWIPHFLRRATTVDSGWVKVNPYARGGSQDLASAWLLGATPGGLGDSSWAWRWGGWLLWAGTPKESTSIWCTKCSPGENCFLWENCLLQESSEFQRQLRRKKRRKTAMFFKGEARQQEDVFKCCESQIGVECDQQFTRKSSVDEGTEGNFSAQSSVNSEASLLLTTHAIDYQAQICAPQGRKSYLLRKKMVQERKKKLT